MRTILFFTLLLLISCTCPDQVADEKTAAEVDAAERDFAEYVAQHGVSEGFLAFAADNAVIKRGDSLIIGKQAISDYINSQPPMEGSLEWEPDFVEVSKSGDLAYTYGNYTYTTKDSLGNDQVYSGVFHTVWKRQADGSWKYVWD